MFIRAFVIWLVDYCTSLLSGSPDCVTNRLQWILKAAARLLSGTTVCCLWCTMICAGSSFQSMSTQVECYCIVLSEEAPKYLVDCCTPFSPFTSQYFCCKPQYLVSFCWWWTIQSFCFFYDQNNRITAAHDHIQYQLLKHLLQTSLTVLLYLLN